MKRSNAHLLLLMALLFSVAGAGFWIAHAISSHNPFRDDDFSSMWSTARQMDSQDDFVQLGKRTLDHASLMYFLFGMFVGYAWLQLLIWFIGEAKVTDKRHDPPPSESSLHSAKAAQFATSQPPTGPSSSPNSPAAIHHKSLALIGENHTQLVFKIETAVGKTLLNRFGEDAQYFDEQQFTLRPRADGDWEIAPNLASANETLVNGAAIKAAVKLRDGDTISVGRQAKGVSRLPLRVSLHPTN